MNKNILYVAIILATMSMNAQEKDSLKGHSIIDEVIIDGVVKPQDVSSELTAKLPINNLENPQVTTSVTPQLINNRNYFTQGGMLSNAVGVAPSWAGISPYYSIRGFRTRSSFRNGVNGYVASDMDPVNIAQLEVIKGPSAVIFGGAGATMITFGGLINRITMKPQNKTFVNFGIASGSNNYQRAIIDVNTPIGRAGKALARITGAYTYKDSFQDQGFSKTLFLAPSIYYRVNDRLNINVEAEILDKIATNNPLFEVGAVTVKNSDELNLPYYKSFTDNSIILHNKAFNIYGKIQYKISDNWKSETNLISVSNKTPGDYQRLRLDQTGASITRRLYRMFPETISSQQIQQDFVGDFHIGNVRNRMVAGVEYYRYLYGMSSKSANYNNEVITAQNPDLYNNEYMTTLFASKSYGEKYSAVQNHYSVYVSDVINPMENLSLMVSARVNYVQNKGTHDYLTNTTSGDYNQTAFSPKLGINYQILPERISIFASYMNGFQNEAPRSVNGQMTNFRPQYGNQFEAGAKVSLQKGLLDAVISYYNINVSNIVRQDPNNPSTLVQNGERYSRGWELDVHSSPIEGLFLHAGGAYNDSELVVSDAKTQGLRPVDSGAKLTGTWYINYVIPQGSLRGFSVGFGGSHYGKDYITNSTSGAFYTNAYSLYNAMISFDRKLYTLSLTADNLFNQKYWYGGRGMITPGNLRQVILSLKIKL